MKGNIMSIFMLERRRQIEGLYRQLELVRRKQKNLLVSDTEYLTVDNIHLLEIEEETLLSRILKLKATG
jgi:hypothetical protein